jgi:hypothetical protein
MTTEVDAARLNARLLVWWIIWAALLAGVTVIYLFLGRGPLPPPVSNPFPHLIGLVPLFISVLLRWLVLPKQRDPAKAFVLFILGTATGEGCAILGIFFGGPFRDELFTLGALGIVQWMPLYARSLYAAPTASSFRASPER